MRASMFMKLDAIAGESEDDDHEGWIDILSWSWGLSQAASAHIGGGGTAAQCSVQDLSFVKWVDKSTPALLHSCASGKHVAKAELHCTKSGGDNKALDYIVLKMDDVIISSVSAGGSGGEDRLTENVSLNFAKVEYTYTVQTKEGAAGAKPKMDWDIKKGKGSVS
ncbi:MAG: type VI secretion system tube protein Hcp [Gammaproteobacteria bacterium]|nr:type VI secretion system tube protein Hcp [Gammaproteobacteria bacterium]